MQLGREYSKLWVGSVASNLGDGVRVTAIPLLAATLTRDPRLIAGLWIVGHVPWLLFGLAAGALVDRVDRRVLMVAVDVLRAVVVGAVALAIRGDAPSLPLLYLAVFMLGAAETLFDTAAPSILPALVARERLELANGRLYAAQRAATEFGGPALGAALFALAASLPFVADAATFLLSALLVAALHGTFRVERKESERTTLRREVAEGVRWVWSDRVIRSLVLGVGVLAFVDSAWFSILILYALKILGVGAIGFGVLLIAGGVGSVAGGLAVARIKARVGTATALTTAIALLAATQLVLGLTSSPPLAVTMLALSGLAFAVWNVLALSLRQMLVPDALLGRVTSTYRFVGLSATAAGALAGGVAAQALGLRAPFLLGAPMLIAAGLLVGHSVGGRPLDASSHRE